MSKLYSCAVNITYNEKNVLPNVAIVPDIHCISREKALFTFRKIYQ